MIPHVFLNLCDKLKMMDLLQDCKEISVEEGMTISLWILCHDTTQRIISKRFQHSTLIMHYWFKSVLRALKTFALKVVKIVDSRDVQPEIQAKSRWYGIH